LNEEKSGDQPLKPHSTAAPGRSRISLRSIRATSASSGFDRFQKWSRLPVTIVAGFVLWSIKATKPWSSPMFIAMNRFRVAKGSEAAFEHVWLSRDTHLDKVPGFVEFHLLKGPEAEDHTLYASHTVWEGRAAFEAWTKSEAFRAAHHRAGENKPLYLGHPQFEGFEVRQTVGQRKAQVA
jgi:heme-degrading monooxygenase HmoA